MGYRRNTAAQGYESEARLVRALAGIGMNLAVEPDWETNIEDALIAASREGMEQDDLRVLALLTTWLGMHHPWINVDRLTRALAEETSNRMLAYWSAIASWLEKDRRFSRLSRLYKGPQIDLLHVGTDFQFRRHGEDERFEGTVLRVPATTLRDRADDVLSPSLLSKHHRTYRFRILIGPSYRADMWAALEDKPSLSPTGLARATYGSFATAWQVKRDFQLIN